MATRVLVREDFLLVKRASSRFKLLAADAKWLQNSVAFYHEANVQWMMIFAEPLSSSAFFSNSSPLAQLKSTEISAAVYGKSSSLSTVVRPVLELIALSEIVSVNMSSKKPGKAKAQVLGSDLFILELEVGNHSSGANKRRIRLASEEKDLIVQLFNILDNGQPTSTTDGLANDIYGLLPDTYDVKLMVMPPACPPQLGLRVKNRYRLKIGADAIILIKAEGDADAAITKWPFNYIRKFGQPNSSRNDEFWFESGSRCATGPGVIRFETSEALAAYDYASKQREKLKQRIQQSNAPPPAYDSDSESPMSYPFATAPPPSPPLDPSPSAPEPPATIVGAPVIPFNLSALAIRPGTSVMSANDPTVEEYEDTASCSSTMQRHDSRSAGNFQDTLSRNIADLNFNEQTLYDEVNQRSADVQSNANVSSVSTRASFGAQYSSEEANLYHEPINLPASVTGVTGVKVLPNLPNFNDPATRRISNSLSSEPVAVSPLPPPKPLFPKPRPRVSSGLSFDSGSPVVAGQETIVVNKSECRTSSIVDAEPVGLRKSKPDVEVPSGNVRNLAAMLSDQLTSQQQQGSATLDQPRTQFPFATQSATLPYRPPILPKNPRTSTGTLPQAGGPPLPDRPTAMKQLPS